MCRTCEPIDSSLINQVVLTWLVLACQETRQRKEGWNRKSTERVPLMIITKSAEACGCVNVIAIV
jgi:hypothetical protein